MESDCVLDCDRVAQRNGVADVYCIADIDRVDSGEFFLFRIGVRIDAGGIVAGRKK